MAFRCSKCGRAHGTELGSKIHEAKCKRRTTVPTYANFMSPPHQSGSGALNMPALQNGSENDCGDQGEDLCAAMDESDSLPVPLVFPSLPPSFVSPSPATAATAIMHIEPPDHENVLVEEASKVMNTTTHTVDLTYVLLERKAAANRDLHPTFKPSERDLAEVRFRKLVLANNVSNHAADDFTRMFNNSKSSSMRMTRAIEREAETLFSRSGETKLRTHITISCCCSILLETCCFNNVCHHIT